MKNFMRPWVLFFVMSTVFLGCKNEDNEPEIDPTAENKKQLGTSAEDLLKNSPYPTLTIELAFNPLQRPQQASLDAFKSFILERVNKTGGVRFVETIIPLQEGAPFTIDEIRDIEDNVRTQFTSDNNIAVFVFFSNGISNNDTPTRVTLGTAYRNTSMVIFEATLQGLSNGDTGFLTNLEIATLNHEFGHLLGLTNIQNDDIHQSHEDPQNARHCLVEDCIMYFDAVDIERSSLRTLFGRGPVPQLDPLCIEDLRAKGGK